MEICILNSYGSVITVELMWRVRALCCAQTLLLLFSVDDLTGFEITKLVELPDPWGIVVVWGLVLPLTYIVSSSLTNLVLSDFLILKARTPFASLPPALCAHGLSHEEEEEGRTPLYFRPCHV